MVTGVNQKGFGVDNKSDHDLLTELNVKVDRIESGFSNHLKHHWIITMVLLTSLLGLIGSLILALLSK